MIKPLIVLTGILSCIMDAKLSVPGIYLCTWDKTPGESYRFDSEADTTDARYPFAGAEASVTFLDIDRARFFSARESDGWWCDREEHSGS